MNYSVDTKQVIHLSDVHKRFADHPVLTGIDLDVRPGEVLNLLGPNGAGKTTMIRIMTGLLPADSGDVVVTGTNVRRHPNRVGAHVGIAPQELGIYPHLTTRQNLRAFGEINGLSRHDAAARADTLLESFDLGPQARQSAATLSGGQKRRLHTAIALVHQPEILFLDEPTVGADVGSRLRILDAVHALTEDGAAVVYTTHYLPEMEQLGGRVAVLAGGQIAADGPIDDLIARWAQPTLDVAFTEEAPELPGWHREGNTLRPEHPQGTPGSLLASLLACGGVHADHLADVRLVPATLETAYLAIVEATHDSLASDQEACDVVAA